MREPDKGYWMEFRGDGMDRAAFEQLLTQLRVVSLEEFESALPSAFVTADDRPAAVRKILDEIEAVTGVTVPAGTTLDTKSDESDPYQLGADIAGQYACAWIAEFADGDDVGRPGTCRRGCEGHGDLASVAGAAGDGRRGWLLRGRVGLRRHHGRRQGP